MEKPREPMTYTRALNILGLDELTEEQLKKAYRDLAKKYHPDNYMECSEAESLAAEDKMKEVNEAHDFLDKLLKGNDIEVYRTVILAKMKSYYQNMTVGDKDLINGIKNIADMYGFLLRVRTQKEGINDVFKQFLIEVKEFYKTYQERYYEDNFIYESDVTEEINYDSSAQDFYKQLCRIKERYSRKDAFLKRVDYECLKYQFYDTYNERIKVLIGVVKNNIRLRAENNKYDKMDEYILAMHEEIEGIFASIAEINSAIASFQEEVTKINDSKIIAAFNKLKKDNEVGKPIADIKRAISELREMINNYKKKQDFLSQNKPLLDELYMRVSRSFNQAMAEYNETLDFESMKKALEFYTEFLSYYQGIVEQKIDIAAVSMLTRLTFREFDADNNILNAVCKIGGFLIDKIYIYMNMLDFSFPKINVLGGSNDGKRYYMTGINDSGSEISQVVAYSDIDDLYMSLNEFVDKATYIGKHGFDEKNNVYTILYVHQGYMICLEEDGCIKICNQIPLRKYLNAAEAEPYQDRDFLKREIARMMQERLFKLEKQEEAKNNR